MSSRRVAVNVGMIWSWSWSPSVVLAWLGLKVEIVTDNKGVRVLLGYRSRVSWVSQVENSKAGV